MFGAIRHPTFSIAMATTRPREPRLSHDRRILLMALASAMPGALISLIFLWGGDYTPKVQWTLTVVIVAFCLGFANEKVLPLCALGDQAPHPARHYPASAPRGAGFRLHVLRSDPPPARFRCPPISVPNRRVLCFAPLRRQLFTKSGGRIAAPALRHSWKRLGRAIGPRTQ